MADIIEVAGAKRYMTLDPHDRQVQGFFAIPADVLTASHMLIKYLKENLLGGMKEPPYGRD